MFERISHIILKEFIIWFRNKRMRFFLFVPPLLQVFLFGYVANMDIKNIRTVFVDLDQTYETREIRRMLESSGYFEVIHTTFSAQEATKLIDRGTATCAVIVRSGFSKNTKTKREGEIQVIVDGTDSNVALVARSYVDFIIGRFLKDAKAMCPEPALPFVDCELRTWFNPDLKSRNFFLPGVIALVVTITCLLITSISIVWERETGTIEQLMVTPIRPFELILGKTIPSALIGFFDMCLVTSFAIFWFDVPLKGGLLFLFLYTSIYLFCTIGIGLFISTISKNLQQTILATFLFFQPAILLSGFATPIESMPKVFQYITFINPLRYYLAIIRGVFLKGSTFFDLLHYLVPLFLISFSIFIASTLRLKKKMG